MAQRGKETIGDDSLENWELLGSGGFGWVFRAKHKAMGIAVAIKLLNDSSGTYDALCQEAEHMEAIKHQYVPKVYGMYQGCPPNLGLVRQGIVMELMEGGSLLSLQETLGLSKPPPWPLAFRLAHQVALAMDFLHNRELPLVHMDLKPSNILLDANLNAKIADFGLSIVSNSVQETRDKGVMKGCTPAYTPPEAFRDDYHRVRSYDVYSYGILLWTILTGESPYPSGNDRTLLEFRIQQGDRPNLDKIDVQKAAGLADLVDLMQRCWDPEPDKRPAFGECVEVTSGVFSRHEEGIDAAVFDILKLPPRSTTESTMLKEHMLNTLDALGDKDFATFKSFLQPHQSSEGFRPIPKSCLEKADRMDTVDLIVHTNRRKEAEVMVNVLRKIDRNDLAKSFATKDIPVDISREGTPLLPRGPAAEVQVVERVAQTSCSKHMIMVIMGAVCALIGSPCILVTSFNGYDATLNILSALGGLISIVVGLSCCACCKGKNWLVAGILLFISSVLGVVAMNVQKSVLIGWMGAIFHLVGAVLNMCAYKWRVR